MFRKILLLVLLAFFYYWIAGSQSNLALVKGIFESAMERVNKLEIQFNLPKDSKKKRW